MKKKIGILLFWTLLLCSGCGRNEDGPIQNDFNEPSASSEVIGNIPTAAGSQVPYWAQGTQIKGNLYQGLNLDGVGEADDEVYVSMYLLLRLISLLDLHYLPWPIRKKDLNKIQM